LKLFSIDEELAIDLDNYSENTVGMEVTDFQMASNALSNKYSQTEYADFVRSVTSIGMSSFGYWDKNLILWSQSFGLKISPSAKAVVKADISGAIIGGTWGGVTGGFVGGIGAVPGAMLGAGIASSFGSAAAGIWEFFGW
jgi:hypothetical protein